MIYIGYLTVNVLIGIIVWALAWILTCFVLIPFDIESDLGVKICCYTATFISGIVFGWTNVVNILIPIGFVNV
jgi:hypothetical protein